MWEIKKFFRKIKNLIRWFPIIWKDEDWDQYYIYEVLKFKLKNQAKYIGGHNRHTCAKRDAEIMNTCIRLIDKLQEEFYNIEYLDYQENKIDFEPIPNTDYFEMKSTNISDNLEEYFKKYPLIYKKVIAHHVGEKLDKYRIAMHMSRINHDRARKLLFKILEQNIEKWWD